MATLSKMRLVLILVAVSNIAADCERNRQAATPRGPLPVRVATTGGSLKGIALEPGGKTLFATSDNARLLRIDLLTGSSTTILERPRPPDKAVKQNFSGIAIEPGGKTALVIAANNDLGDEELRYEGELVRVDLTTGTFHVVASKLSFGPDDLGIVIEEGKTALVAERCGLTRVNLSDGTKTPVTELDQEATCSGYDLAIEPSSQTVLSTGKLGRLWRIGLATGETALVSDSAGTGCALNGVALAPSSTTAFVVCQRFMVPSLLLRVDLSTGRFITVTYIGDTPTDVVVEEGGATALVAIGEDIYRVQLP